MTSTATLALLIAAAAPLIVLALRNVRAGDLRPLLTIGLLFFIFGFVTWLNGPLITFVKLAFDLDDVGAFLVPMAFYLSYFFLALPSAAILRRTGMKSGMALGLLVMAAGAALFGYMTTHMLYHGALAGLFVIGAGLALLQTASNPYVSIIGPIESGAQRIAFMGICNKFAGILAPIVFAALVMSGLDDFAARVEATPAGAARQRLLEGFAAQIYWPYMAMAAMLALLALWIAASKLPDVMPRTANQTTNDDATGNLRHLWLGVACLFLYVGVEVLAGDAIGIYGAGFGLPLGETRFFTSYTLAAMLIGYVAGLYLVPRHVSQERYLAASAALGVALSLAAWLTTGHTSVLFIASLGFANAMMWPAIFPLAIRELGARTEFGSALLIMAIAGGAILPYAFALLKQIVDFQTAYLLIAVPSYLYILHYGLSGHRIR